MRTHPPKRIINSNAMDCTDASSKINKDDTQSSTFSCHEKSSSQQFAKLCKEASMNRFEEKTKKICYEDTQKG